MIPHRRHSLKGYRRPEASHRLLLEAPRAHLEITQGVPILPSTDFRSKLQPIRNQGEEGACSGFSTAANREGARAIQGSTEVVALSPAYLYARTRMSEGSFPADAGASIADEMAVLQIFGVCPETCLPYNQDPKLAPTDESDKEAIEYAIDQPLYVDFSDPVNVKQVLSRSMLVTIGFDVYQSFEHPDLGVVPLPAPGEQLLGGHGVLVCGYDDRGWIVRNQWGEDWGDKGYCYMPHGYEKHWVEAWTFRAQ